MRDDIARVGAVSSIEAIEREWDDLARRARVSPFRRPGWFQAWWRAFGTEGLEVMTLRRGDRLVGVLPVIHPEGRASSPANTETPEFGPVAENAEAVRILAEALFARRPRSVFLRFLDASGEDEGALRDVAMRAGYTTVDRKTLRRPYVEVTGDWRAYELSRTRNVRGDIRRRIRRLRETEHVALEIDSGGDVPRLLEEGYRIEGSGWKDASGTAIRLRSELHQFYTEVAQWAAANGWLRLCFLRQERRPIAFHLNLVVDDVLYHLKGGFDTAFARFSPGKVLHYLMLEHAFQNGLRRYEFLGEDEAYKLQLASGVHEYRQFHAFAPSATAQLERLIYALGVPVARRLLDLRER